jgi:precorrin-6A/cobalt-precorrin-6A reductase
MPTMDSQRCAVQIAGSAIMEQTPMRVLILGGTTEASGLAHLLAADHRFETTLSLAGRTANPRAQPLRTRIGGFGGADGLAAWLQQEAIEAVIDATHPYADQISSNAVTACKRLAIPLATLLRPAWRPVPGDRWLTVANAEAATDALGPEPRRVFLSLGRLELGAFAASPHHHYLARMIEPPEGIVLPRETRLIFDRGPFDEQAETTLLTQEKIDVLVSKNSGGTATYAKIAAARKLGIPVVMIARPHKSHGHVVDAAAAAARWLEKRLAHRAIPGSARGV